MSWWKMSGTVTYSFEVPMYHIARMEVVEAIGNVAKLGTGISVR